MSEMFRRLLPQGIGGQIVALVLIAVILTFVVSLGIISYLRPPPLDNVRGGPPQRGLLTSALVLITQAATQQEADAIAKAVNRAAPPLDLRRLESLPLPRTGNAQTRPPQIPGIEDLRRSIGPGLRIIMLGAPEQRNSRDIRLGIVLPNGEIWAGTMRIPPGLSPPSPAFLLSNWLVLLAVFLPVVLLWSVHGLTRQLRNFAQAAEEFSLEGAHAALPETGPKEIKATAQAFNRMRTRLAGLAEDRTRMLTAVGHDLRTPVTRLRLRAEFISDPDIQQGVMTDIARMDNMIDAALTYLRDGGKVEPLSNCNLAVLLKTVTSEFADTGINITYEGPDHLSAMAHPDLLTRAVENLIQNAARYGDKILVRLQSTRDERLFVDVDDNGPGIPASQRDAMLKPFVRGDAARTSPDGGFGLGLSIANDGARAHGGTLELSDSPLGGLRCRINLPT